GVDREHASRSHAGEHASWTEYDLTDCSAVGDADPDDVTARAELERIGRELGAPRERREGVGPPRPERRRHALVDDALRHPAALAAEPDESRGDHLRAPDRARTGDARVRSKSTADVTGDASPCAEARRGLPAPRRSDDSSEESLRVRTRRIRRS